MKKRLYPIIALISAMTMSTAYAGQNSCPVGMESFHEYRLFFGRSTDNPQGDTVVTVNDEAWEQFVKHEITPRFPDGLTIFDAQGQFKTPSGTILKEYTKVVMILVPPGGDSMNRIDEIMHAYGQKFQRKFFLRTIEKRLRIIREYTMKRQNIFSRILYLLGAISLCALPKPGLTNLPAKELKVISFNIRFENPADGKNNWPFRLPLASTLIKHHAPDLMGTQEGYRAQVEELGDEIRPLEMAYSDRPWIENRMYPCIFYNPAKLEELESGDIWLSKTPYVPGSSDFDSAWPRLATWTLFRHKQNQKIILMVNTHLDHVLSYTRHEQIKVLVHELQPLLKNNPLLLLAGDFNEAPTENVRREINNGLPQLLDPWYELNQKEETTTHKFKGHLSPDEGGARIDWILTDKRLTPLSAEIDKSSTEDGVYPSDHFPVITSLTF